MSMREEFEKWVSGKNVCKKYGAKLRTNADGSYSDYRINDRWISYLAGAKAMQEEAAKVCDESGSHMCADAISAINPENLLAVE